MSFFKNDKLIFLIVRNTYYNIVSIVFGIAIGYIST